jgi:hypothetical protein
MDDSNLDGGDMECRKSSPILLPEDKELYDSAHQSLLESEESLAQWVKSAACHLTPVKGFQGPMSDNWRFNRQNGGKALEKSVVGSVSIERLMPNLAHQITARRS